MVKEMTPKSRKREQNQQGSLSAKTARLLKLYEDDLAVRYRPRTGPAFLAAVRFFLRWLHARGVALLDVRTADLQTYQSDLLTMTNCYGKPYSLSSQNGFLVALKNFFRFLYRRGYLLQDPAASLELPRRDKRLPRVILSKREVRKLLGSVRARTPTAYRDRAILEALYATGIRASELSDLTPYDVDADEKTLRVVLGKGGKDRLLPLTNAAVDAISKYLCHGRPNLLRGKTPYLFLQSRGGKMRRSELSRIIHERATRAGLKKRVTPHTFRHSVATHLLQGRADIRHIQALLGHACLSTTQLYTQVALADLRRVIARAHPRGR
jgi:integrase/recombinase XerD